MASAQQTVLALGASHLSFVSMAEDSSGGLVLENVVYQTIGGDPGLSDRWLSSVDASLGQLVLKAPLKSVSSIVLPGWAVLTKLLKVARIDGAGQREVVRFEAANALPSGLDGYNWSYSILRDDGYERDVLVQAVSATLLNGLLALLKRYGVKPLRIDSSISGELAAFKQQYAGEAGASVLLDIGARSVSLVVSSAAELPFIRSFNFGGSLVTQSLSKLLGKPFPESERLKLEWIGSQNMGANLETLNQSSEGFVNRVVNEVQRSLALYRRQGQSGNPARILLTGGASQLPGLSDFLERKTGIPTTLYDPFRELSSGPGLNTAQTSQVGYSLPAPIGMVLGEQDSETTPGNLLPAALSSQLQFSEKKPWLFAAAALLLISGLVVGLRYHLQAWDLEGRIVTLEAELAPLESLSQKVKEAHKRYGRLTAITEAKRGVLRQKQYWVAFLADLQNRLNQVEDVWVESIERKAPEPQAKAGRLRVTGSLLDRENPLSLVSSNSRGRVEVLLGSFENSPFIESVNDRRFDTSRPGILRFEFSLVVNPDAHF